MDNSLATQLKSLDDHISDLEKRVEKLWKQWIPFQTEGEKRVRAAAQNIGLRRLV
jgi:archaellum component FlaC